MMTWDVTSSTLYDFPFSSSAYRLRIAVGLNGVTPAQIRTSKLREGAHLAEDFMRTAGRWRLSRTQHQKRTNRQTDQGGSR